MPVNPQPFDHEIPFPIFPKRSLPAVRRARVRGEYLYPIPAVYSHLVFFMVY
jgi:hypothetical protein